MNNFTKRYTLLAVIFTCTSTAALADGNCPSGLTFAGRLYTSSPANAGSDVKVDQTLALPQGIRLDRTYQQNQINATSGGGAQSPLSAGDIPRGLFIYAEGSDSNGKRWAVLPPYSGQTILGAQAVDEEDRVTGWKVTFGLYADTGTRFGAGTYGGADIKVDICYKLKQ